MFDGDVLILIGMVGKLDGLELFFVFVIVLWEKVVDIGVEVVEFFFE